MFGPAADVQEVLERQVTSDGLTGVRGSSGPNGWAVLIAGRDGVTPAPGATDSAMSYLGSVLGGDSFVMVS